MAVPVVMQAGFELEPLAGEAQVERQRAGQRLHGAPGLVLGLPHQRLGRVRHANRPVQVIRVDVVGRGRRVDAIHNRDRPVDLGARGGRRRDFRLGQPDVLAHRRAGRVEFGDDVAATVVDGISSILLVQKPQQPCDNYLPVLSQIGRPWDIQGSRKKVDLLASRQSK